MQYFRQDLIKKISSDFAEEVKLLFDIFNNQIRLVGGAVRNLIIDKKVNEPIPEWVDKCMIYSINKKQNIGFSYKLPLFYYNCINQSTILYISWKELEIYLDNIITKQTRLKIFILFYLFLR